MEETKYPTAEQIAAWKNEHKALEEFSTESGGKAILRRPRMTDLEIALDKSKKAGAKSLDFNRVLYRRCMLWCNKDLLAPENEDDALEVLTAVGSLAEIKEAQVKKL